jgi:hypothetical protein
MKREPRSLLMFLFESVRGGRATALLLAFGIAGCIHAPARAQLPGAFDPLKIPTALYLCRPVPADPADSAAFEFEFIDRTDSSTERITLSAYDSTGRPFFMLIHAPEKIASGYRVYVYAVRFQPVGSGNRVVTTQQTIAGDSSSGMTSGNATGSSGEENLSESAVAQAREFSTWLWAHRCKSSDGFPKATGLPTGDNEAVHAGRVQ